MWFLPTGGCSCCCKRRRGKQQVVVPDVEEARPEEAMRQTKAHCQQPAMSEARSDWVLPFVPESDKKTELVLEARLFPGEQLVHLTMAIGSTGTDLHAGISRHLPRGSKVKELIDVHSGRVIGSSDTMSALALHSGSVLHVITRAASFLARDAGIEAVNGYYFQMEDVDGAPCFTNEAGTLLKKDAVLQTSGSRWCFIAPPPSLQGHYYQEGATQSTFPPLEGWSIDGCCAGVLPAPKLEVLDDRLAPATMGADSQSLCTSAGSTQSAESARAAAELGETVELEVLQLSGECIARLSACSRWTGKDVRLALLRQLPQGMGVDQLILEEGSIFDPAVTVESLGLADETTIYVVLRRCDYMVTGATPRVVNGCYFRERRRYNRAPCFTNEDGTLLFRYQFRNGAYYWYFSQQDQDLDKSTGDYFRVKTTSRFPPEGGWTAAKCPLGCAHAVPKVVRWSQDDEDVHDVEDDEADSLEAEDVAQIAATF